jgi:hypothetical protein
MSRIIIFAVTLLIAPTMTRRSSCSEIEVFNDLIATLRRRR